MAKKNPGRCAKKCKGKKAKAFAKCLKSCLTKKKSKKK